MSHPKKKKNITPVVLVVLVVLGFFAVAFVAYLFSQKGSFLSEEIVRIEDAGATLVDKVIETATPKPKLDVEDYNRRVLALANKSSAQASVSTASTTPATTNLVTEVSKTETSSEKKVVTNALSTKIATGVATSSADSVDIDNSPWPPEAPLPLYGAILPFKRIIAYYGNLYSTRMGVLGEYPEDVMLKMLDDEVQKWEAADPTTPVQPALHHIASTAQVSPGKEGLYTLRMPDSEIDKIIAMAEKSNSIVFLDLQIGLSDLKTEIPYLDKYLKMPNVHLGLDPEFSMKGGEVPGTVIGTMDATDINYAANYLAEIVKENNLPPKILVVHRFTNKMLTNYQDMKPLPEVQIVIEMDGWGSIARKINTYKQVIYPEPVQFAGIKIFYKNDLKEGGDIMTPADVLNLNPKPIYIQYQ